MTTPYVQSHETHTGVVLLIGDRAYKLKKPVDFGFCDFTSAAKRAAACRREVELNRRLAPDAYLGVGQIHLPDRDFAEPVVVMRRMPAEARLSAMVQAGRAAAADIRQVARVLAAFHERCHHGPATAAQATSDALARRWAANLAESAAFAGPVFAADDLPAVEREVMAFLAGRDPLFRSRIDSDRIVDGHGDLLADDIFCLDDGPRILDCLEFDDRLRHVDRIDDVAFLAMDLERLGAPGLAAVLVAAYREFSGDTAPASLVHHYMAYRAFVRAKVACLRYAQGDADARRHARALAGLTRRHLDAGAVRLVLVGGLPGTGKTTLAGGIADELGYTVLSSDRVRKELAGLDPEAPAGAEFGEGLYTPARTDEMYAELLRRARELLGRGESVVLDATWSAGRHRAEAARLAAAAHSPLVALRCVLPADVAGHRMVGRRGPSDADASVAAAIGAQAGPWTDMQELDTSQAPEDVRAAAVAAILPRHHGRRWSGAQLAPVG